MTDEATMTPAPHSKSSVFSQVPTSIAKPAATATAAKALVAGAEPLTSVSPAVVSYSPLTPPNIGGRIIDGHSVARVGPRPGVGWSTSWPGYGTTAARLWTIRTGGWVKT